MISTVSIAESPLSSVAVRNETHPAPRSAPPSKRKRRGRKSHPLVTLAFWAACATLIAANLRWHWTFDRPLPDLAVVEAWIRAERYDEAERACRDWLARSPHHGHVRSMLARALAGNGRYLECARTLEEIPVWWPDRHESLFRAGQAYLEAKRAADAERCLLALLPDDPLHPVPTEIFSDAGLKLIELYVTQERIDDAKSVIRQAYERASDDERPLVLGMRLRVELDRLAPQVTASDLNAYVEADPDDWRSRLALARAVEALGDRAGAESHWSRLLADRPHDPIVLRERCRTLRERGDLDALEVLLDRLPLAARDHPAYWSDRGAIASARGDLPAAIEAFETALRRDPHRGEDHYRLALALARAGDRDRARAHVARNKRLAASFAEMEEAYTQYIEAAEAQASDNPDAPDVVRRIVEACRELGMIEESIAWARLLPRAEIDARSASDAAAAGTPGISLADPRTVPALDSEPVPTQHD